MWNPKDRYGNWVTHFIVLSNKLIRWHAHCTVVHHFWVSYAMWADTLPWGKIWECLWRTNSFLHRIRMNLIVDFDLHRGQAKMGISLIWCNNCPHINGMQTPGASISFFSEARFLLSFYLLVTAFSVINVVLLRPNQNLAWRSIDPFQHQLQLPKRIVFSLSLSKMNHLDYFYM